MEGLKKKHVYDNYVLIGFLKNEANLKKKNRRWSITRPVVYIILLVCDDANRAMNILSNVSNSSYRSRSW